MDSAKPDDSIEKTQTPKASAGDAATVTPPTHGTGGLAPADEATLIAPPSSMTLSVPFQDLSQDKLLISAPRVTFENRTVPALGNIPLLARLGQGGMGAVYFGLKTMLKKEVA